MRLMGWSAMRRARAEIDLRVEAVELGCAEQRVDGSGAFSSGIRAGEEVVLAAEGDDAQRAFGGVVVDLELPSST